MATIRQKKLAKAIVKNLQVEEPLNKKELLVSVGYDTTTAEAMAERTLEAQGVQDELKALGFDEQTAKEVVGTILVDETVEPRDRLKAAGMVFETFGTYAPVKTQNLNYDVELKERERELLTRLLHR